MKVIEATIGKDKYITNINANNKQLISDEPIDVGGQDKGLAPSELLASALGACTCITMRMYADRKEWNVEQITITVSYERNKETRTSSFKKEIQIMGDLDETQTKRLLQIADKCPIHFTLTNPVTIDTVLL